MDRESEIPENKSRSAGIGPGERLQAARVEQGLSIDDVASRMHLSINIIESIENNRFDDITAPIFVKGYLRAYARIVSLDEDELIRQFGEYYSHEDPPIATTSHMAPELSVADVRIKWTTYLVILGLAALLAAWWWSKQQGEVIPISLDSQSGQEQIESAESTGAGDGMDDFRAQAEESQSSAVEITTSIAEPAPMAEPAAVEPAEPQAEPAAPATAIAQQDVAEPPAPAAPEPVEAEPAEAVEPATQSLAEATPESADEADSPSPEDQQDSEPAQPVAEAEESAPLRSSTPILVAPTGEDKLSITVIADTWADIEDASDFQMVYHLLRAGQSLELTGSAPFSVFLGNGHGVEIRFNGEQIEFSRRIRNDNTTRLSIGG